MKINPFGGQQVTPKKEPVNYINGVVQTTLTIKTHKEEEDLEDDRSHVGHKTTEGNREIPIQVVKNSVTNAEITIIKTIYSLVPPKIKFVPNAPNGAISLRFAVPHK